MVVTGHVTVSSQFLFVQSTWTRRQPPWLSEIGISKTTEALYAVVRIKMNPGTTRSADAMMSLTFASDFSTGVLTGHSVGR